MSGPRRRLPASEREQQLLDTAEKLFSEQGFDGVSMDVVARVAGVTRPVVYQHFSSKEELFLGCARRAGAAFEQRIRHSLADAAHSIEAQIRAGGAPYFDMVEQDPKRWALIFTTAANISGGALADRLTDLRLRHIAHIAEWSRPFADGVGEAEVMVFAHAVSGIGEQLGRWWLRHPDVPKSIVLDYYVALVGGAANGMRAAVAREGRWPSQERTPVGAWISPANRRPSVRPDSGSRGRGSRGRRLPTGRGPAGSGTMRRGR